MMSKIKRIIRLLVYPPMVFLSLLSLLSFVMACVGGFLVFAFLPFILIWVIGSADAFTCNHLSSKQTLCQHESWRLFGLSYQQEEWQLQEARPMIDSGGEGTTYSLSLATSKGEVKLSNYWSDEQKLAQDVDQFNQLLKSSSQPTFYLRRGNSWFNNIMLFLVVAGLARPCFLLWSLVFHLFSNLLKAIVRFFRAIPL